VRAIQMLVDDAAKCLLAAGEEGKIRMAEALRDRDFEKVNELGMAAVAIMMAATTVRECQVALNMIKNAIRVSGKDEGDN
jgi:hypothetical protein